MDDFQEKVVLITGGARGQGRSHAVAFAEAGADIAIIDVCQELAGVPHSLATSDDLAETVRAVEDLDRRCIAVEGDVRDTAAIDGLVERAINEFGHIDIAIANAGIAGALPFAEISDSAWEQMIGINLTGVFKTMRAVTPHMVERERGRIIATSSMGGRFGFPMLGHYVAAKFGVIGMVKTLALELADKGITVNAVCPTNVSSPMLHSQEMYRLFRPDLENPREEDVVDSFMTINKIPVPWVQTEDVTNTMLFVASDKAWYMTGSALDVGCGITAMHP
jgi:SDR family mycofactocin-dependent oxidoreductase